jgi:hypothetical protein
VADLWAEDTDPFLADPKGTSAATLLGSATSRIVYDLERFTRVPSTLTDPRPVYAATIARETHVKSAADQGSKLQVSFSYSDGFGREIQRKIQAEASPLVPNGTMRWICNGWIIFNNKGKPVRQYEPFFTTTADFEFSMQVGVSPILFYDPLDRVVATVHPAHTFGKVIFDPWRQQIWDPNDTVTLNPTIEVR